MGEPTRVVDSIGQWVRKDTQEAIAILQKYFEMLQSGTHIHCIPDPFFEVSPERVEHVIMELDEDFRTSEGWRIGKAQPDGHRNCQDRDPENGIQAMPEFHRLCSNARIAMVQELDKLFQHQKEHPEEYFKDGVPEPEPEPQEAQGMPNIYVYFASYGHPCF